MSRVHNNANTVAIGDVLHSTTSDYLVQSFSGRGTFGLVAKCLNVATNAKVAIKMIKNTAELIRCTAAEVSVLCQLRGLDPDKCNIVRWYDHFSDRGSSCLVFEQLDRSLQDFMVERNWAPLHIKEIRPIVQQAASALSHLEGLQMVHGDIKLPNMMLVNHGREPLKIKLIDFGLACKVAATRPGNILQTLPYRCPEVLLGLPLTVSIDMWSLGCVAAELLLGKLLFHGLSKFDMMVQIIQTVGQPPDHLLSARLNTSCFFVRNHGCPISAWTVKTMGQYHAETGEFIKDLRRHNVRSLDQLLMVRHVIHSLSTDYMAEMTDMLMFVDMLKKMLMIDASQRIRPQQLLRHQFISMRKSPGDFQTSTSRATAYRKGRCVMKTGSIFPPAEPQPQPLGPDANVSQAGKLPPECRRKEVHKRKRAESKSPARPKQPKLHQLGRGEFCCR